MLNNQVIIVLGSNGKIGKSFVKAILENNGTVIMSDIKKIKNSSFLKNYKKTNCHFIKTDCLNQRSLNNLFQFCFKKFNKINAVINCTYPKSKKFGMFWLVPHPQIA